MDWVAKLCVMVLILAGLSMVGMLVFCAIDPYATFDLDYYQIKLGLMSIPKNPTDGWGLALYLALNQTAVKYIGTTVLNETTPKQIEEFKHNVTALVEYMRGWIKRHIKYKEHPYLWVELPDVLFRRGYGVCIDYAELFIGTMMYLNYSPVFLVITQHGNHATAGVKVGNDILFFDEWYNLYLRDWIKWQPNAWWGYIDDNEYYMIAKVDGMWKVRQVYKNDLIALTLPRHT